MNAPLAAAFAMTQPINALLNSGFSDLAIERISLKVTSVDARSKGLDRLSINRSEIGVVNNSKSRRSQTESGGEYIKRINVTHPS